VWAINRGEEYPCQSCISKVLEEDVVLLLTGGTLGGFMGGTYFPLSSDFG